MKSAIKAALLSGLAFPGAGHIFLKRYRSGLLLLLVSLLALVVVIRHALRQALDIVDKIQSGVMPLDPLAISQSIEGTANTTDSLTANIAWLVFIACWVLAIVDSFRIGKNKDANVLP